MPPADSLTFYQGRIWAPNAPAIVAELVEHHGYEPARAQRAVERLPGLLATDFMAAYPGQTADFAELVVDQTFGYFLIHRGGEGGFVPSDFVDAVFEAFMLRSHLWTAFCTVVFGGYLHHVKNDEVDDFSVIDAANRQDALEPTLVAMRRLGGPVDAAVWATRGKCCTAHQCICDTEENKRRRLETRSSSLAGPLSFAGAGPHVPVPLRAGVAT